MDKAIFEIPLRQELKPGEKICIRERIEYYIIPHTHPFYEIVYILDGKGTHSIDGYPHPVTAGDLLFIDIKKTHMVKGDPSFRLMNIIFLPGFISDTLLNSTNANDFFPFLLPPELSIDVNFSMTLAHFRGKEQKQVDTLTHTMLLEFEQKSPGYRTMLKSYLQILFCMAMRNIKGQLDRAKPDTKRISPEIFDYIDKNCFSSISLRDLSQKFFYSSSYFSHLFKETCGKSLSEYIKEKRITEAMRLLAESDMSISDICRTVGYQNRKLFNKFFKQIVGRTPTEYRIEYDKATVHEFSDPLD